LAKDILEVPKYEMTFHAKKCSTWSDLDLASLEHLLEDLLHGDVGVVYLELVEASVGNIAETGNTLSSTVETP